MVPYTDGIVESMNAASDQFGLDRLCRLVERVGTQPVADTCGHIKRAVLSHTHRQKDDMTLLVTRSVDRPTSRSLGNDSVVHC